MFDGLISRWMMCFSWTAYSPRAANWMMRAAPPGERSSPRLDQLCKVAAVDVLHHDVIQPVLFPYVVNQHHVGMLDAGADTSLAEEPLDVFPAFQIGGKDLQGHRPFQGQMLGQVDLAHPAMINEPDDTATPNNAPCSNAGVYIMTP